MQIEQAFAELRSLELTDTEVQSVLARRARPRRRRVVAVGLAFAAAAVIAVAVPQSRAEVADALRAALHGGSPPGETVPVSELPGWLKQVPFAAGGEPRVIAKVENERMLVYRHQSGSLCFDLGGHGGLCGFSEQDLFAAGPVALMGPTPTAPGGPFDLWGLALASVVRVEVRFADRPSVTVPVDGAFGVALPPDSSPRELVVYGAGGKELKSLDLSERWQHKPTL